MRENLHVKLIKNYVLRLHNQCTGDPRNWRAGKKGQFDLVLDNAATFIRGCSIGNCRGADWALGNGAWACFVGKGELRGISLIKK